MGREQLLPEMRVSPRNFVPEALEGPLGSFQSVGGTHRQNKPQCVPFPCTILKPCSASSTLWSGEEEEFGVRIFFNRNFGFVPFSHPALSKTFLWKFRGKSIFFKGALRVLLTQVVQLILVRVFNTQFVENIPFQRWIQLLSSSTFILQRLVDVEDDSA